MNGQSLEENQPPATVETELDSTPAEASIPAPLTPSVATTKTDNDDTDATEKKKKKKKKNKLKKNNAKFSEKGSIRGIETMFRSSCRTQLALTALADNKANMLISTNGFILTIVIASGGLLLNSEPYLLLPVSILLISSLVAMFLAIRAARPNINSNLDVSKKDFFNGKANILFFGHFVSLSGEEYLKVVNKIMKDRELTYTHIAQHTHGLGIGLVRKFKLLQIAYSIFISGLALSIALFFVVYISQNMNIVIETADATEQHSVPSATFTGFKPLDAVIEASGVQQLPDGRFLTVNDEKDHPFDILTLDDNGEFTVTPLYPQKQFEKDGEHDDFRKLADLEGIDMDSQGYLYATTSHSYSSKGIKKKSRKKLVRFQLQGEKFIAPVVITSLEDSIKAKHDFFASALENPNSKSKEGFNIEGLSLNPAQDKLLLGLRAPLKDGKAIVLTIDNIHDVFNQKAQPEISEKLHYLDLGGEAIRSLNYIPRLEGYLVVSGPIGKSEAVEFKLWLWKPETGSLETVSVDGLKGFEEAEGLAAITWKGQPHLLIITDGTLQGAKTARYIILKYEQLHIGSK